MSAGGDEVAHVIVGKPGPDFMSTYLRPVDQDNVYRVSVYLRTQVDRGDQTWRHKTILKVAQSEIASYTATDSTGVRVTVGRDETGQWRMSEPKEGLARSELVPMVLQAMADMIAELRPSDSEGRQKISKFFISASLSFRKPVK